MATKPSIPKGTRDFNPEQVAKRNYIFSTIKSAFETFGFQPIETPSFENSDTLMGKYGEEGDRLIFKILNSGDYLGDFNETLLEFIGTILKHLKEVELSGLDSSSPNYNQSISKFINSLNDKLKETNKKLFSDEKLRNENFVVDILNIIVANQNESKEFENLVKTQTELAASIVFSDFYYRLKPKFLTSYISEKALRYDLTVPFARYVVQHQNEIAFPFKRYQIQPVWRADRPQKGRFREFYQCDADVVGSQSLLQEVEFIQLYDTVFTNLNLKGVTIKINNRKILSGIAEVIGAQDKLIDFTVALDKLDKIGEEKVKAEMLEKGIPESGIEKLQPLFSLTGSFESQIQGLKAILSTSEDGKQGIQELEFINNAISNLGLKTATLQLDVTLARGLNYYTGAIFEVSAPDSVKMGSIGGGGRYDDLTGIFGLNDVSGVGISFGLDRIYLVLEELDLFPETVSNALQVLFFNFGDAEALACMQAIKLLREKGVNTELYPDSAKMKKQMTYANRREVPFIVLVGSNELENKTFTLKNMQTGDQETVTLERLTEKFG